MSPLRLLSDNRTTDLHIGQVCYVLPGLAPDLETAVDEGLFQDIRGQVVHQAGNDPFVHPARLVFADVQLARPPLSACQTTARFWSEAMQSAPERPGLDQTDLSARSQDSEHFADRLLQNGSVPEVCNPSSKNGIGNAICDLHLGKLS